jgi:hypothetical protein
VCVSSVASIIQVCIAHVTATTSTRTDWAAYARLPTYRLFPPPAFGERRHGGRARCGIGLRLDLTELKRVSEP